jgi:hypothetical protein
MAKASRSTRALIAVFVVAVHLSPLIPLRGKEGVMVAFGSNRITNVAKGWPADKAGIRPGDIMEKPWDARAINGYMRFTIIRDGRRTEFYLQTDNICFRDRPW